MSYLQTIHYFIPLSHFALSVAAYSVRRLFTGFAIAALPALMLTISKAVIIIINPFTEIPYRKTDQMIHELLSVCRVLPFFSQPFNSFFNALRSCFFTFGRNNPFHIFFFVGEGKCIKISLLFFI